MEECKNGIISEKSLEEISSGINVDKVKLRNALIAAGVVVTTAVSVGVPLGIAKYKLEHPNQ